MDARGEEGGCSGDAGGILRTLDEAKPWSTPPWAMTPEAVLEDLETDAAGGLGSAVTQARLSRVGKNALPAENRASRLLILIRRFGIPVVLTLVGATVLSGLLGDRVHAAAIASILVISSLIGYFQEIKAQLLRQ